MATQKKKKRAKKKASRKAVPQKRKPTKRVKSKALIPTTMQPGEQSEGMDYLRRSMSQDYIFSRRRISTDQLLQLPMYRGKVSRTTVHAWAVKDRWKAQRQEWHDKLTAEVKDAIGTQLVKERIKELERLNKLKLKAEVLLNKALKMSPKSPESMINTTIKLSQRVEELQKELAGHFVTQVTTNIGDDEDKPKMHPTVKPKLSNEEAYQAAKTIVRMRRNQYLDAAEQEEQKPKRRKKKPLKVVK